MRRFGGVSAVCETVVDCGMAVLVSRQQQHSVSNFEPHDPVWSRMAPPAGAAVDASTAAPTSVSLLFSLEVRVIPCLPPTSWGAGSTFGQVPCSGRRGHSAPSVTG